MPNILECGRDRDRQGSCLRTFALELKEQLAQTLAAYVTSILAWRRGRLDAEEAGEPPLRQIVDVLQQVMCAHDAEKLGIAVLEIYEGGYREEQIRGMHNSTHKCIDRSAKGTLHWPSR